MPINSLKPAELVKRYWSCSTCRRKEEKGTVVSGCDFCSNAIPNYRIKYYNKIFADSLMSTVSCCKDNAQMNFPIFGGHFEIFCKLYSGKIVNLLQPSSG